MPNEELYQAVQNDLGKALVLLRGFNKQYINDPHENGNTLLHVARYFQVFNDLMTMNPDVNALNNDLETLLHSAVKRKDLMAVNQLLIKENISINLCDKYGNTPLDIADSLIVDDKQRENKLKIITALEIKGAKRSIEIKSDSLMNESANDVDEVKPTLIGSSTQELKAKPPRPPRSRANTTGSASSVSSSRALPALSPDKSENERFLDRNLSSSVPTEVLSPKSIRSNKANLLSPSSFAQASDFWASRGPISVSNKALEKRGLDNASSQR